jgi:diguanylate cyclase (GGDEF)-like protein
MLNILRIRFRFLWAFITQPNGLRAYSLSILAILLVGFLVGLAIDSQSNPNLIGLKKDIRLDQLTWYGKVGFEPGDEVGLDSDDPAVIQIQSFPVDLNNLFDIAPGPGITRFALGTRFILSEELLSDPLAIYINELGENWAVYVNGHLIQDEIYLQDDNTIAIYRSVQRPIIFLPESAVKEGENTLVFQMIGNRPATKYYSGTVPGFTMASGFVLGSAIRISRTRAIASASSYFQIGMYAFWGLFMFIFFRKRKEIYALQFGVFLLIFAGYSYFSSIPVFDTIRDTSFIIRMMDIDIILCVPIIGMSFWNFLWPQKPLPIPFLLMNVIGFIGAVFVFFLPYRLVGTLFFCFSFLLAAFVLHIFAVVFRGLSEKVSDARSVFGAAVIVLVIAAWSLVDMVWVRTGFDLISWTPFCLSIVFASIFTNRYWEMGIELVDKNQQLLRNAAQLEDIVARRTEELTDAKHELEEQLNEIQHLQMTLAEQAMRDPLTGLYNRRYMEESLKKEFARAERKDYPISLVMLDIDHFKKLNDTYSHAAGDQVLQVLGNILGSHVRVDDYAIRYGGEEFLIIFPQTPYARAVIRANQLRELIEKIEVKYNGAVMKITVSAGVAGFPDHGATPEMVLSSADIALYKAKTNGRNRVEVYLDGDGLTGNEPVTNYIEI